MTLPSYWLEAHPTPQPPPAGMVRPFRLIPPLPDRVIVEASALVKNLHNKIAQLPVVATLMIDQDSLVCMVLQALSGEQAAETCLVELAQHTVESALGNAPHWAPDVEVVAEAMLEFGEQLYRTLQALKLYRGGFLHYQFASWIGTDLLLHRVDPPQLDGPAREYFNDFRPLPQHFDYDSIWHTSSGYHA